MSSRLNAWQAWGLALAVLLLLFTLAGELVARRAGPLVKSRILLALSIRFRSHIELDDVQVSLLHGLEVFGQGLRISPLPTPGDRAAQPLITVQHFAFHTGLRALFQKPLRIDTVHVSGLEIRIPARGPSPEPADGSRQQREAAAQIVVEHFSIRDSRLLVESSDPAKAPKVFGLKRVDLERVAEDAPLRFDATVVNAVPQGEIHANGSFGPWIAEKPGTSSLRGHFLFNHADLSSIHGLSGMLRSTGNFAGQLNRIEVTGSSETPDFALDTAHQPMPLHTTFHAVVDETTGNTSLENVEGLLRNSAFTCRGSVMDEKGKGHRVDLAVDVPDAQVQDFLALAVRTRPVLLSGRLTTSARLHIRPGHESVLQRLTLDARFTLRQVRFSNPAFQDKVDQLSLRAQGLPAQAALAGRTPPRTLVNSGITGQVTLSNARMNFDALDYTIPGAEIQMNGIYSLDGEQFDFKGKVRTQAQASGMVQSWWKQLLLHAVDKYLSRNGAGVEIPFTVNGTRSAPKFGLDLDQFLRDRQSTSPAVPAPIWPK